MINNCFISDSESKITINHRSTTSQIQGRSTPNLCPIPESEIEITSDSNLLCSNEMGNTFLRRLMYGTLPSCSRWAIVICLTVAVTVMITVRSIEEASHRLHHHQSHHIDQRVLAKRLAALKRKSWLNGQPIDPEMLFNLFNDDHHGSHKDGEPIFPPGYKPMTREQLAKYLYANQTIESALRFTINKPDICEHDHGAMNVLLVAVISSADHFEQRQAIRETWGLYAQEAGHKLMFLVGQHSPNDEIGSQINSVQPKIQLESDKHEDIIQTELVDHYENLPLKTLSLFHWVKTHCGRVLWVMKVDDDSLVNMQSLIHYIDRNNPRKRRTKTLIVGRVKSNQKPYRQPSHKYFVPYEIYSQSRFPSFTSGPTYLITGHAITKLYQTHFQSNMTLLNLEDVYWTGVVAQKARVTRVDNSMMANKRFRSLSSCKFSQIISAHSYSPEEIRKIWKNGFHKKCRHPKGKTNGKH